MYPIFFKQKGNKRLEELMKKHPNVIDPNSKFQKFKKGSTNGATNGATCGRPVVS